ncbi:MAG TPA: LacI family DNA-binding transcriptional regulator, partial [Verrucomicrobiae bacterium]|nr:LacI family DNA-binding transcriptional regulator [Verrucomicrobiae bacterium]
MPVVMEDVAARAGVSATTVSHVLNETRTVAPQTRRRVLEAVRELNYYTNASARLLVRGRADTFGLIISDIENPFFPELIKSFERACLERRMGVLLCTTNYDPEQARNGV